MKEYQERVLVEKEELDSRTDKLQLFIQSDKFEELSAIEKNILNLQLNAMNSYSKLLGMRINLF